MKKLFITTTLLFIFSIVSMAQQMNGLGLPERRALKEYQVKQFPQIKKDLIASVGFDIPLDVKWEQLAKIGEANYYKEDAYWGITIFRPLIAAMRTITVDKEGSDALKAKLQKIVIMHDANTAPASNYVDGLSFENGVFTVNFTPYSNADEASFNERVEAIKKFLESRL